MREFLIWWNNNFPYDRQYRVKYSIAFNSEEHRKINQIDVYLDLYEDYLFKQYFDDIEEERKRIKAYKEGKVLNDSFISKEEKKAQDLFDKLDFSEDE